MSDLKIKSLAEYPKTELEFRQGLAALSKISNRFLDKIDNSELDPEMDLEELMDCFSYSLDKFDPMFDLVEDFQDNEEDGLSKLFGAEA